MGVTTKIESKMAMSLEAGKLMGSTGWGFNGNTIMSLGANDAFPYLTKNIKVNPQQQPDESIEGLAFEDLPVQVGLEAPMDSLEWNVRYDGMDKLWYWLMGYEDGGSSPEDLGGGYYRKCYELDSHERHFTAYRTAEQTAGDYNADDRKNRFGTFAFALGPNDYRYHHQLCSGFSIASTADDGMVKCTAKAMGPKEGRADYSSSSWTYATALQGSSNSVLHRHLTFSVKPSGGAYVELGVSNFNVEVEIPLSIKRDCESGLYIIEPTLAGQVSVSGSFVISRHSVDTYMGYRDSWQECVIKAVYTTGSYSWGLYFPSVVLSDASLTEEDVPTHPITFNCGKEPDVSSPVFSTELSSINLIQGGQMMILADNTNSTNEMRRE